MIGARRLRLLQAFFSPALLVADTTNHVDRALTAPDGTLPASTCQPAFPGHARHVAHCPAQRRPRSSGPEDLKVLLRLLLCGLQHLSDGIDSGLANLSIPVPLSQDHPSSPSVARSTTKYVVLLEPARSLTMLISAISLPAESLNSHPSPRRFNQAAGLTEAKVPMHTLDSWIFGPIAPTPTRVTDVPSAFEMTTFLIDQSFSLPPKPLANIPRHLDHLLNTLSKRHILGINTHQTSRRVQPSENRIQVWQCLAFQGSCVQSSSS